MSSERPQPTPSIPHWDAVVIGAGITGIYQAYQLRELGMRVRGIEAGADVGGTWFWNRYPGCRLDTESYAYAYFSLNGLMPDWQFSERFAAQPELLRYVRAAAQRMDIRKDFQFNTRVLGARYREESKRWEVVLDDGARCTCQFLLSAVGPLSAARMPQIPGMTSFSGQSFHSSQWPREEHGDGASPVDFHNKRVAVIGTGATGVQIIPVVARQAKRLYVFQRTPNWCTPLGNHPLNPQLLEQLRGDPAAFLSFIKSTPTAFPYDRHPKKGTQTTPEERQALFESLYDMPGYGIWLSGYRDLLTSEQSNQFLAEFVANKIRQRVKDPHIAEKLIPRDHRFGVRRVPMETDYYEVFNEPHVQLLTADESPIESVTPAGICTPQGLIDLDIIIYATGFEAVTGALDRMDIVGRQGQLLREVWADGPTTYLGLQAAGFPNFFTLVGPHNGAAFCNIGVCGALQVEWVTRLIDYMRQHRLQACEPKLEYQEQWTDLVYEDYAKTLLAESDAWWVKVSRLADGTIKRRSLIYIGGAPEYRQRCETVAHNEYEGFSFL